MIQTYNPIETNIIIVIIFYLKANAKFVFFRIIITTYLIIKKYTNNCNMLHEMLKFVRFTIW